MCLAIPAKVIERKGTVAKVDFGKNVTREVDLSLVEANVGDYVLIHAGFAIEVLNEQEALKTLEVWDQLFES